MSPTEDDRHRRALTAEAVLLTAEVGRLNRRLEAATRRIAELAEHNDQLSSRARRHSLWIYATVAGLAISLVALAGVVRTSMRNAETILTLASTQERLKVQVEESCSFYGLIIGSYRPESRPPGTDRDTYEQNFARMRRSFTRLECVPEDITPPAGPTSSPPR